MNKEQNAFLDGCRAALQTGALKQAVLGYRGTGRDRARLKLETVAGERKLLVRVSDNRSGKDAVSQIGPEAAAAALDPAGLTPFQSGILCTQDFDLHYAENRKREPRLYKSKASMKGAVQSHNKQKNYVLAKDRPYLQSLGIANASGAINASQYPKFRQIANFVEIIDRSIGSFVESADAPITLLDLGCGKGYLTFAAYDYIASRAKFAPAVTGVDIKFDVIALCNTLARELGFKTLSFQSARIGEDRSGSIDILVALHACDTATDDALALGVRSGMKYFFCAPCCQAQIAAQIKDTGPAFSPITQFPLMKRRQADVITDVCRALLLNALGYDVTFLEFTALEHTPKNIMLAGRINPDIDRRTALHEYRTLKQEFGFAHHALEDNIRDLLPVL